MHLHLRGSHDGLWHPLPYGALKRRLHVCKARCSENCLPLSHYRAAHPYVRYARGCLERRSTTGHGSLRNLGRKWGLRSRKLLREKTGVFEALW